MSAGRICFDCRAPMSEREARDFAMCDRCHALRHSRAPSVSMTWPCGCDPDGCCPKHAAIVAGVPLLCEYSGCPATVARKGDTCPAHHQAEISGKPCKACNGTGRSAVLIAPWCNVCCGTGFVDKTVRTKPAAETRTQGGLFD